jgi:hypothetical protein
MLFLEKLYLLCQLFRPPRSVPKRLVITTNGRACPELAEGYLQLVEALTNPAPSLLLALTAPPETPSPTA